MRWFIYTLCLWLFCGIFNSVFAQNFNLSLEAYLKQVAKNNSSLLASQLIALGSSLKKEEANLLTQPQLFSNNQVTKNNLTLLSPVVSNVTQLQSYQAGLQQKTPYGIGGKFYYSYQKQVLKGLPQNPASKLYGAAPVVEVTASLGRNFTGSETRATKQLINSQDLSTIYGEKYKIKTLLANAEITYLKLALIRQMLVLHKESLDRMSKNLSWIEDRVKYNLAGNSDLLQAKAAFYKKQLDLQNARNEEKLAIYNFNSYRGLNSDSVPENLISYQYCINQNFQYKDYAESTDEVKSAFYKKDMDIANAILGVEKNKPDIELYASYALNGNNASYDQALSDSFSMLYPNTAVGVRLTIPLNISGLFRINDGYESKIRAAHYEYKDKLFQDKVVWKQTWLRLKNIREQLEMSKQLEKIQLDKLNEEKQRLKLGKTTTFQVLTFEQDYADAQLSRLSMEDELFQIHAQLKHLWGLK
jgi:outer membrane protein TolC